MNNTHLSLHEAKQIDLVDYLHKLGHQPQKIRNHDYWFLSPLREEKTASFKVNRKLNAWYDFELGEGGTIIDFAMLYHRCNISEALRKLQETFSFHQQTLTAQQPLPNTQKPGEALEPAIKVIAAKPLASPSLRRYLADRKIPFEIAKRYCKEVDFELYGKTYFAIGFENNSGGFELRNRHFKGSSSPKDITVIKSDNSSQNVAVFEGFFCFLSYLVLHRNSNEQLTKFLVLNSLSFFKKSRDLMEEHGRIYLHLDRDNAGIKHTQEALQWSKKYVDKSSLYKDRKDLNDYLVHQHKQLTQLKQYGRHL